MSTSNLPPEIGPYRVLGVLGEGGMGTVYLAEQVAPVRRRVAVKVVKLGLDTHAVMRRFELERQALAMMNHDAIARVFDCGATATGQPYFVMELVEGTDLLQYCDRNRLPLRARIELFLQVCDGVQHAHQKGVLHRDLKPGNVLVSERNGRRSAKIIDFGVARSTDHQLVDRTLYTEQGVMIGTPEYMSPEQAAGEALLLDTRSDVYSLGVVLFELLCGELPFPRAELRRAGLLEIQRQLREVDPGRPSARVAATPTTGDHAAHRATTIERLRRELHGDLDWITLMAMAKEPDRRYGSAQALADDLRRFLDRQPVLAGPPTAAYQLRKFWQRHRAACAAVLAVGTALLGGVIATWREYRRAETNATLADERANENAAVAARLRTLLDAMAAANLLRHTGEVAPISTRTLLDAERQVAELLALRARLHGVDLGEPGLQHLAAERGTSTGELQQAVGRVVEPGAIEELQRQVEVARRDLARFGDGADAAWTTAAAALAADPRFPGQHLTRDADLLPLGPDPQSGLQEFAVALSGNPPRRGADGALLVAEDDAIVLVLLPGGTATVGAQPQDESFPVELPPRQLPLAPFFLGKYEVTQAQWRHLAGTNPSRYTPETGPPEQMGPRNPVEMVGWTTCDRVLRRFGLELPTEAQWEYAARAGTTTPWWTGPVRESLAGGRAAENIADATSIRLNARFTGADEWRDYDDGGVVHVDVGSYRANPFGLFDVLGNVKEWCADPWVDSWNGSVEPGTGRRRAPLSGQRVVRGGSFFNGLRDARSAARRSADEEARFDNIGVRAARLLRAE